MHFIVSLQLNLREGCVIVKQIGSNSSALNGFTLVQNRVYKALHGDILEILHNKYFQEIVFDPPEPLSIDQIESIKVKEEIPSFKRTRSPAMHSEDPKKIKLTTPDVVASTEHTWITTGSGKLLIFTAKGVISRAKV